MMFAFKQGLRRLGLYYPVLDLMSAPAILRWLRSGCPAPAPPAIKRRIVRSYVQRYRVHTFVETGTYLGDTLEYVARTGVHCLSVELSPFYFKLAQARFAAMPNVELLQGDSRDVLRQLVAPLNRPALFWLDGHYSGGNTALGPSETPIIEELKCLLARGDAGHIILIDDARCFDGTNGYPALAELMNIITGISGASVEISNDIVRITPLAGQSGQEVKKAAA
jgi:hypothetical protein